MSKRHTSKVGKFISMACLLFVCATVQSCRDEYYYDDREPRGSVSKSFSHVATGIYS